MKGLRFQDWVLIALVLLLFWLGAGCASVRPVPALVRAPSPDSLKALAALPAYLVPPPAQASARQVARWTDAQTQALANVNAPDRGRVKLKNVGNTDSDVSVQQGLTGRQLSTAAVIVALAGLVLWLKPWRR
ncbi:hypothetical protein [Hymenobacter canadensis]|uniref:Translation initiation factor 2 n=1 Tax=Hymenobacter canadensis TaxID=2999067 RepID=A0ABY7LTQ4_9BACT|nr:hypothetical protein [Hymenobacter canadensis]WBA42984.1 hypothetical protein O3303_05320 [Hymenobacter canadensis]